MTSDICIAAAQTGRVDLGATSRLVDSAIELIDQAHDQGVQLLTFPELFLSPFFPCRLEPEFDRYFMMVDAPEVKTLAAHAASRGMASVIPVAERASSGYFNAAVVYSEKGETLGVYRKTHIPAYFPNDKPGGTGSYEKFYFTPGNALPIFKVCGVKIGVQICNDRLYPEASRALALQGAQILVMPISFSTYSNPDQRASIWEVPLRARAYENGVYVVASNRAGTEGPRHHFGNSMIVDPYGMIVDRAGEEASALVVHMANLKEVERARAGFPWWRDRRPDLYGDLVK